MASVGNKAVAGGGNDCRVVEHQTATSGLGGTEIKRQIVGQGGDDGKRASRCEEPEDEDDFDNEVARSTIQLTEDNADNSDAAAGLVVRPYSCLKCQRHYTRAEHLRRHTEQKHSTTRRFNCDICGRSFVRRDVFKKHVALHSRSPALAASLATEGRSRDRSTSSGRNPWQSQMHCGSSESTSLDTIYIHTPRVTRFGEATDDKHRRSIANTDPSIGPSITRNTVSGAAEDEAPTMAYSGSSGMPSSSTLIYIDPVGPTYQACQMPHTETATDACVAQRQDLRPSTSLPHFETAHSALHSQDHLGPVQLASADQNSACLRTCVPPNGVRVRCGAGKARCPELGPCGYCDKRDNDCMKRVPNPNDLNFPSDPSYLNIGRSDYAQHGNNGQGLHAWPTQAPPSLSAYRLPPLKPYLSASMANTVQTVPVLPPMMTRQSDSAVIGTGGLAAGRERRLQPFQDLLSGPHSSPFPQLLGHAVHNMHPATSGGVPPVAARAGLRLSQGSAVPLVLARQHQPVTFDLSRMPSLPVGPRALSNDKEVPRINNDTEGAVNLLRLHSPPPAGPLSSVTPAQPQSTKDSPSSFLNTDPGPNIQVVPLQSLIAGRHWAENQLESALRYCQQSIGVVASYHCNKDVSYYLPDVLTLRSFLASYFKFFHKFMPFLHAETFDPCKVHWLLLLTVASVGARYLDQCKRAVALLNACKAGLRTITVDSNLDDFESSDTIQIFQAYLLIRISSPNALPSSMQLNLSAACIVRYFKSQFEKQPVHAEDWDEWIRCQKKKRLALAFLYYDSLQSILTESPSSLPIIDALDAKLPDSAIVWCAGSAQEWLQAYTAPARLPTRTLFETMQAFLSPDEAMYVHHLVKTDTAIARFTFLLARMLHGQAHALQGVVGQLWCNNHGYHATPSAYFGGATERLHKLLFHHGERNWNLPSAKPCFTVTPLLLEIAASIRFSALRGFARESVPAATAARSAVSQWMRTNAGRVAKKDLWRAVQVFTMVINLKDHDSMTHYARGPSIFYSACVIHAYGDVARVYLKKSAGLFKYLEADESADEPLYLDEQPDDDHPDLHAWLNNTAPFRPYISPSCTGNALSLFRDTSIILHHAVAEISRGRAWAESNAEFAEDLLRLVRTSAMLWEEQDVA